jgi:DNA-binding HxlR family transcriptional regulator
MSKDDTKDDPISTEEIEDVLKGMVAKGLLKVVGVNEKGETLYELTPLGRSLSGQLGVDPKTLN